MSRYVVVFCLSFVILCSVGCRLCPTPFDSLVPAFIERPCDYRGFNVLYRAGSVTDCWGSGHHVVRGTFHGDEFFDVYNNAGDFGVTTPISPLRHTPDPGPGTFGNGTIETRPNFETQQDFVPRPNIDHQIGIPHQPPADERFFPEPRVRELDGRVPTIEELLLDRQRGTAPLPMPVTPPTPPGRPGMAPQDFEAIPTMPFSPSNDRIAPPNGAQPRTAPPIRDTGSPNGSPTRMDSEPPITLEELRRLDPTIQDVQIISIEDVTPGTRIR